jgi:hypothetical protein
MGPHQRGVCVLHRNGRQEEKKEDVAFFFFFFFFFFLLKPIAGSLVKERFALGGSGSVFVYGFCDSNYRAGMNKEECLKFVRTALALAM